MSDTNHTTATLQSPAERLCAALAFICQRGPELAAILTPPAVEQPEPAPMTAEPVSAPETPVRATANGRPKGYLKGEPVNPPALGEGITAMEVDAIRWDERAALRCIRDHGPMTVRQFHKQHKARNQARLLDDLIRFGLVAMYQDKQGWTIIHATEKSEPIADWEGFTDEFHECCARLKVC